MANLHSTAKALGFDIDYKRLLEEFQSHGTLVRAFYYTAVTEDQEFSAVRPLLDWLDYNGFTMVTKPTREFIDANGHRKVKGNMDIELTVGAMELADRGDHIVLFSGDGAFARWSNPCSDAVFASPWSPRFPASRQCLPTSFAARRTCSPITSRDPSLRRLQARRNPYERGIAQHIPEPRERMTGR
jgi:NYN domain